jgi:hypothetical protein
MGRTVRTPPDSPIHHLNDDQTERAKRLLGLDHTNVMKNTMTMHQVATTGLWIIRWEAFRIVEPNHPVITAILGTPAEDTTTEGTK